MSTTFNDMPRIQNQNLICILDGGQAMSDDKGRATFFDHFHSPLDNLLCLRINVGSRLIQDQNFRIGKESAGKGNELALPYWRRQLPFRQLAHQCPFPTAPTNPWHPLFPALGESHKDLHLSCPY